MGELYLIRHGQASFGEAEYDRLSDLGRSQAKVVGSFLKALSIPFDAAYCGTLERQRETARLLLEELGDPLSGQGAIEDGAFDEHDSFGIMKGLLPLLSSEDEEVAPLIPRMYENPKTFQRVFSRVMSRWVAGDAPEGVESWRAFTTRVASGIAAIRKTHGRGRRVLVVSSGGPIAATVQLALGLSDMETLRLSWQIRNASLSVFQFNDKAFSLSSFNGTAHLEMEKGQAFITYR